MRLSKLESEASNQYLYFCVMNMLFKTQNFNYINIIETKSKKKKKIEH